MIYRDKISTRIKSSRGARERYESIRRSILAIRRHLLRAMRNLRRRLYRRHEGRVLASELHMEVTDALRALYTFYSASDISER